MYCGLLQLSLVGILSAAVGCDYESLASPSLELGPAEGVPGYANLLAPLYLHDQSNGCQSTMYKMSASCEEGMAA